MELFAGIETIASLLIVVAVALIAGLVKGVVGFAMPMIMISGLTLVLPPDKALAALILPTLVTNGWQALRQGLRTALQTTYRFRVFLGIGAACLVASAQLVRLLDPQVMVLLIGGPVLAFALLQLAGWQPRLSQASTRAEVAVGALAGSIGGVSGIWGPPTVAYLTAINTPKAEQMRAQGVIYGLGAVALAGAHLQTGVLSADTAPLTLLMLPFALIGLWLGFRVQDQIEQATFRKATLIVLAVAGANLIRRGLMG